MFRTLEKPMTAVTAVTDRDRGQETDRVIRLRVELLEERVAPVGIAPAGYVAEAKLKNA